ncbi:hypothetical protein [Halomicrobium urmianum]|uniref:hypothetical protein n=1 Tax=Halomicrobium urmianum TaxID=1586233 RepID=UPI001CD96392|nr:hypothetical protein [Halomicrobium urmianum]
MALSRRDALRIAGTTALASVAGCSSPGLFEADQATREYSLSVDRMSGTPVDRALYEPGDDQLFGEPAREAIAAVVPDGRHTTYGYESVRADAYVEHDERYYQTKHVVTGRKKIERTLVRVDPVPEDAVSDDAPLIESFERPTARVLKILHSDTQSGGEGSSAELLRGDAYVLRRPAERSSALAAGDLDGRIATMTESGTWAYRIEVATEEIVETAHTALAVEVADSRAQFREVVFGSRVDAEIDPDELAPDAREILQQAVRRESYRETAPVSDAFEALLDALGLEDVETGVNGKWLWYDGEFHRYALYVTDA